MLMRVDATEPNSARLALPGAWSAASELGLWFEVDPGERFALTADGRFVAANATGRTLLLEGGVSITPTGYLHLGTAANNRLLLSALKAPLMGCNQPRRMILRHTNGEWGAADLFPTWGSNLFVLAFHHRATAPSAKTIAAIAANFQLTRVETLVLEGLCGGECPKSVARIQAISEHTVRTHLRSIYGKMGVRGLPGMLRLAVQLAA